MAGRTHGCIGELLTFSCTTSGCWMKWEITHALSKTQRNHKPLPFLFSQSDDVNKVLSDSTFNDITAILLKNYNTSTEANFMSAIFINLTNLKFFAW